MRHQSHQNPSGLFPSHSLLPGYPPSEPRRTRPLPRQLESGPLLALTCWPGTYGQRECSHEVFFFLFILLDKLIISSLSYWGSRSSTILFLPLPSHPLPTPRILKVPPFPFPFPHTPMLCHCSPDKRPSGSSHVGPETLIKVGCRHAVCPFVVLFSANTRTEREARINSQTDTKQRDRDSDLEASHQKDGVREGECPRWQGP